MNYEDLHFFVITYLSAKDCYEALRFYRYSKSNEK